ncbi:TfoX/Sxy family protein [Roseivirga sp. E12]|uniref:TfoX/Sxy family protein n=1 Tax=Roseivirga sp. E12 TaxID=2819237 RepID=UPI001ABC0641|nr:TfoX/Sxy family protein [Roseivirga sp. E12]MBO3697453.1 TfoX/Sxy family protein [Roseivirga sp. E12]
MAVNEDFLQYIKDQLVEFGDFEVKRMFGGIGLFSDGKMFGMIGGDTFRLKVDEFNQEEYESRGMKPYFSKGKKKGMPYWEVPPEVVEDKTLLADWAVKALQAAKRASKK